MICSWLTAEDMATVPLVVASCLGFSTLQAVFVKIIATGPIVRACVRPV